MSYGNQEAYLAVFAGSKDYSPFTRLELFNINDMTWLPSVTETGKTVKTQSKTNKQSTTNNQEKPKSSRKSFWPACLLPELNLTFTKGYRYPGTKTKLLSNIYSLPCTQRDAKIIEMDNKIYLTGGFDKQPLKRVYVYDKGQDIWHPGPPMEEARSAHGLVCVDGAIYAISGCKENNTIEFLDPRAGFWTPLPKLPECRSRLGAAVINDIIYVVGGWKRASVRQFNLAASEWRQTGSLSSERCGPAVTECDGKIYALGGMNEADGWKTSCEVYSQNTEKWTSIAEMPNSYQWANAASYQSRIYLFGGFPDNAHSARVDILDTVTNKWSVNPPGNEMPVCDDAPACALVYLATPGTSRQKGVQ